MGEVLAPVFSYHHQILQPHASDLRIVEARLYSHHLGCLQGLADLA